MTGHELSQLPQKKKKENLLSENDSEKKKSKSYPESKYDSR